MLPRVVSGDAPSGGSCPMSSPYRTCRRWSHRGESMPPRWTTPPTGGDLRAAGCRRPGQVGGDRCGRRSFRYSVRACIGGRGREVGGGRLGNCRSQGAPRARRVPPCRGSRRRGPSHCAAVVVVVRLEHNATRQHSGQLRSAP